MRFVDWWPLMRPFMEAHPWLAPVLAAGFPIGAVLRGLSSLWSAYRSGQKLDHDREAFQYKSIVEQRDAAQRALVAERQRTDVLQDRNDKLEQENDALRRKLSD